MEDLALQTVVVRKKDIIAADMDGETVMMSIDTGNYYNLGCTGGAIWKLLDMPRAVQEIIAIMLDKYAVSREQCEAEVMAFLREIYSEGLIEKI